MLLDGRVAVVSGIGPGMGRAISLALAGEGADVVLAARGRDKLEPVAAEVEALGRRALCVPTDVADPDATAELAARAAEFGGGKIDVLVNNAYAEENWNDPFTGLDPRRWRRPIEINVFGTLGLTQACIPHLKASGKGSIIMTTTLSTKVVNPVLAGYAASKCALTNAAQTLAAELGPDNIRVNCVAPGHIMGDPLRTYFHFLAEQQGTTWQAVHDGIADLSCLKRIPTPEEISGAYVYFASDLSRMTTGQTLHVNCGRFMW